MSRRARCWRPAKSGPRGSGSSGTSGISATGTRRVAVTVGTPGRDGLIDLTFSVTEGRRQVIRAIRVEGARTTHPSLDPGRLVLKPGEPAGQSAVAETQRRLYRLGVFNSADVRLVPAVRAAGETSADVVPVNAIVSVVEPRRYQFVYGVEFASQYGPIFDDFENSVGVAADVRDRNVFGRGMSLSVGGRYEPTLRSVRALFVVPKLGSLPIRTNVFTSWRDDNSHADSVGTTKVVGPSAAVEQRWQPRRWMDLSWGYAISSQSSAIRLAQGSGDLTADVVLASVNGAVIIDRRDNALDTRRGWFHSSSWQQGARVLGSDLNYSRYLGRLFAFVPMGRLVSASGIRVGSLWTRSGTTPLETLNLLFHAGGVQTVRGYKQDELSAVTMEGVALGGTRLLVLNQELRFKVSNRFQAVVFADAGNTFSTGGIVLRDLAVSLGVGVRLITPLAPLRLDLGFPIAWPTAKPWYRRFTFSVGHIF